MTSTAGRRPLRFANWDEVIADAENLLQNGYTKLGRWSLGQVTFHLSEWLRYAMDGYPMKKLPWLLRVTLGRWMFNKILKSRKYGERGMTARQSIGPETLDDAQGVQTLKQVVERWKTFRGVCQTSPLFGKIGREEFNELHLIHAEHHLSFLVSPKK